MQLRIKFSLAMSQEQMIWKYINDSLFKKKVILKDSGSGKNNSREDVRITFSKKIIVRIKIFETSKLPEQNLSGTLNDFSLGGVSCEVDDEEFVMSGSQGLMELSFLTPPQTVKISVL